MPDEEPCPTVSERQGGEEVWEVGSRRGREREGGVDPGESPSESTSLHTRHSGGGKERIMPRHHAPHGAHVDVERFEGGFWGRAAEDISCLIHIIYL